MRKLYRWSAVIHRAGAEGPHNSQRKPVNNCVGTNVEWNILKYPVDEANTLFADPYAILGVRTGYKTKHGFEVFFEVKNLANKIYAASVSPIADANSAGVPNVFNPGSGRAFYGGVSWAW
jgi:iron complex outermembrane recepter protein